MFWPILRSAGNGVLVARLQVEVVSGEGILYEGTARMVLAPGSQGQLSILPRHAPLVSALGPGELRLRLDDREEYFAVAGGVMEVRDDRVVILADAVERADEIDVERAEIAQQHALDLRRRAATAEDSTSADLALRRSRVRLHVGRDHQGQSGFSEEDDS